jgi:ribonuclease P protein component
MLAFKYRFHGHGSLRYVYSNGQAIRSRLVTLKYSTHPKRKNPRVAVVISKKVLKSAVGRNRVRRRIYEIVRHELPKLHPDRDIVLIVFSSEVISLPSAELTETIQQLFEPAGLYK